MSPLVAAAPAWIGATLMWWGKPSSTSVRLRQARPASNSALAPQELAPDEKQHEECAGGDVRQALLASGMFSKTDPAVLSRWCEQLKPVRFSPGHVVGARGDFGGRLYVIISGRVKVVYRWSGGREIALTILGKSEIFGGVPLFDEAARETSVTTITDVVAVPIERRYLLMWMAECSEFSAQVLRLFARWAKATTQAVTDFGSSDVERRVATRLLWLRKRFGRREGEVVRIAHDLTLADLSCLVGVAPEIVDKTLRDFEHRGWIRSAHNGVVVVDSQALASVRRESM